MNSIFFDLETTDISPVGQILNFAFIEVDKNWKEVSKFCERVKISRTQLPRAGAICANRVNVLEHQETASLNERQAMKRIRSYIEERIKLAGHVTLIGFNSARFDVPYLRTSMLRNGLSPYFPKKQFENRDLLHVAQKLAVGNTEFRDLIGCNDPEIERPSLRLENLLKAHGFLNEDESQEHESESDVRYTIKLAKEFLDCYGIDVRTYKPYEPGKNNIALKEFPEWEVHYHFDPAQDSSPRALMVKLEENYPYSLWVNVSRYEALNYEERKDHDKRKECVSWYNANGSVFFCADFEVTEEISKKCHKILSSFGDINLENFFPDRNCDVEAFIYMMNFDENRALYDAIWQNDKTTLKRMKSKHASELYLRFLMNNADMNEQIVSLLNNYALYRYGSRMKTNKYDVESQFADGVYDESFHPCLNDLYDEISEKKKNPEDQKLMESLEQFYNDSPIVKISGQELKEIVREKPEIRPES
jgi:hypothetical protein